MCLGEVTQCHSGDSLSQRVPENSSDGVFYSYRDYFYLWLADIGCSFTVYANQAGSNGCISAYWGDI